MRVHKKLYKYIMLCARALGTGFFDARGEAMKVIRYERSERGVFARAEGN